MKGRTMRSREKPKRFLKRIERVCFYCKGTAIVLKDVMFALSRKSDIRGLYFETTVVSTHAPHVEHKVMFWCPVVPEARVVYTADANDLYLTGRLNTMPMPCYEWVAPTHVGANIINPGGTRTSCRSASWMRNRPTTGSSACT